jgi:hypothetical protein
MDYDVTVHITPNTNGTFFVTGATTGRRGGGSTSTTSPTRRHCVGS